MGKPRIIYFRYLFQVFGLLFLAAIPIFDLFRLDLGNKQFLLLGQRFFVQQMYLAVIVFILLMIVLIFFSKIFGRIWCSWLCPQNTWAELGDYIENFTRKKRKSFSQILIFVIAIIGILLMILFFDFVIISVFIDPRVLWQQLITWNLGNFVMVSLVKLTVFGIANMLVVRHSFCWNICPYAMMQRFLANKDTLRIIFAPEKCSDCKGCERVCTMKLKPRYLDETNDVTSCINCGECIKSCNVQAARRKVASSLAYSFGKEGKASQKLFVFDLKTIVTGAVFLLLSAGLGAGFLTHQGLDVSLNKELREEVALEDGWVENYYMLKLRSTLESNPPLAIQVAGLAGESVITPEMVNPTGLAEEVIKISVKTKADSLTTPLLPIKILVTAADDKTDFSTKIKASFYNMGY